MSQRPVKKRGRPNTYGSKLALNRSMLDNAKNKAGVVKAGDGIICRPTIPKLGLLYLAKECQIIGCLDQLIDEYESSLGSRMFTTTHNDWESEVKNKL